MAAPASEAPPLPGLRAPLATLASPACPNAPSSASSPCAVPRGRPPSSRLSDGVTCSPAPPAPRCYALVIVLAALTTIWNAHLFAGSFYVASSGKPFQRPKRVTLTDFSTQPPGVCRTPTTRQVPCGTLKMQDSKRGTLRTGRSCRTEPAIWWSDDKPTNKCVSHCDKRSREGPGEQRARGASSGHTRAHAQAVPKSENAPRSHSTSSCPRRPPGGPGLQQVGTCFPKAGSTARTENCDLTGV